MSVTSNANGVRSEISIIMKLTWIKPKKLSDLEIITGLQDHIPEVEKYFFDVLHQYFDLHFNQLFFDRDSKQEVFQIAIIKLWTEIENKTITIIDDKICRKQKDGSYCMMTATLTTFMMAFAKNEFRELLRNCKDDNFDDISNSSHGSIDIVDETFDENQEKIQIIDDCILSMSPNCIKIITMFYYQKKSLDEIMKLRGEQNASKDGLKTAKNKCMVTLRKRVADRLNNN